MSTSTPETVSTLEPRYVGFWSRLGASILDSIFIISITFPALYMIYGIEYWESETFILGLPDLIISWVFPVLATIILWVYKSATPGKMILNISVIDKNTGKPLTVKQSIIRYIAYYVSLLPLGLGFLWIAWDQKKQGWHDKLAGTVVIYSKQ